METLDGVKVDAKNTLLEMKRIGEGGPTRENAKMMLNKMHKLQSIVDRLDDVPDNE